MVKVPCKSCSNKREDIFRKRKCDYKQQTAAPRSSAIAM
jgi:hypothetical protein